jgi:hypothetical protein
MASRRSPVRARLAPLSSPQALGDTVPVVEIRRATEVDVDVMRRLWEEFNSEATFTPYPAAPFESSLITDHFALVAEEDGDAVGTVYATSAARTSASCSGSTPVRRRAAAASHER